MYFYTEKKYGVEYRYQKIRGEKYPVFGSDKDFETYFMKKDGAVPPLIEDWHNGLKGDWVIADDGGIVQVLTRNPVAHHSKNINEYVRTIVGSFVVRKNEFMDTDFSQHADRYKWGKHISRDEEVRDKRRTKNLELMFAVAMCIKIYTNGKVDDEDVIETYKKIFKYNKKDVSSKAFKLLNSGRIRSLMAENIKEIAKSKGMTFEWVVEGIKNLADSSKDDSVRLKSYITGGKMIDAIGDNPQPRRLNFVGETEDAEIEELDRPEELEAH